MCNRGGSRAWRSLLAGTWSYTVYVGRDDATGKKRYKQVGGFATRRACEDALRQVVDRVRSGGYTEAGATTVEQFVDHWLTATSPTLRPTTAASFSAMLRHHLLLRLGQVKLSRLTALDLLSLYGELLASGYRKGNTTRGLSPTTVRYLHRIIQ